MCFARKVYWLKTKINEEFTDSYKYHVIVQEHANSLFYVSVTFLVIAAAVSTTGLIRVYRTAYNTQLYNTLYFTIRLQKYILCMM